MEMIEVMRPRLPSIGAVTPYLERMESAGVYANFGPLTNELERRYGERFNVSPNCVVSCSSATMGLEGAVFVSNAQRFHCPAWTFPATALSVLNAEKALSFHDVRSFDWQIDAPVWAAGDGLMVVLPFGAEIDLTMWDPWPEVVIDAAASGGCERRDLADLQPGWAVVISLHATKVLGAGEGGIVIFGDPERADRFRAFTSFGFQDRRQSDFRSTNAKMPEAIAAYALAALDDWTREEAEWRAARILAVVAEEALELESLCSGFQGVSPYWIVQFPDDETRGRAEVALRLANISSRRWWPRPCTQMAAFSDRWSNVATPVSDTLAATTLGLPFYRGLSSSATESVANVLSSVLLG